MRARNLLCSLAHEARGTAAAEMALVTPLLLVLLMGATEAGNYFYVEHIAVTAVRDGARYASRQPFAEMQCGTTPTAAARIKNMVRTGTPDASGSARISYWTNTTGITVTVDCPANSGYLGIYKTLTQVPRVQVSATISYQPILSAAGVIRTNFNIVASSQAAVMGI